MYFFPDTAFYEFITEADMLRNYQDPSFTPRTYLMDEVQPGEKYELVLTILKGGAFARYRCGDVYRCVGLENKEDETRIPRFEYVDRVPWIIDLAGFTRISENGIRSVIKLSGLPICSWVAAKEYNDQNRPYLHLYVEIEKDALAKQAMSPVYWEEIIRRFEADGVEAMIEVGPGKTLTGLTKKTCPQIAAYNVENVETLKSAVEALKEMA